MNTKLSVFKIYIGNPLYQSNADGDTASFHQSRQPDLANSTNNNQLPELSASTLQQSSGNNQTKLCLKGFFTITDETLFRLTSLSSNYDALSVHICKVESILLLDASQAFYLADGMYHVVSRHPVKRMKSDSPLAGFSSTTLTCQDCIVRTGCSSTFFHQGDLALKPDLDFFKTHLLPLIAAIQLAPSLDYVFRQDPSASRQFHVYTVAEARPSVLNCV